LKSEQIRNLSKFTENGVAQVQQVGIVLPNLLGQLGFQVLGFLGDKGLGCGFTEVMKFDRPRNHRSTVASHIGFYERIDVQVQGGG